MNSNRHSKVFIIVAVILLVIAIGCLVMIGLKFKELNSLDKTNTETTVSIETDTSTLSQQNETSNAEQQTTMEETTAEDTADDSYTTVNEQVTSKSNLNLRSSATTKDDNNIVVTISNGTTITRIGINEATGWSKLEYNGQTVYAVSSYLTTDLNYTTPTTEADDGLKTEFKDCNDVITAKIEVNLRSIPSITNPDCKIITTIKNGEKINRTGIAEAEGWSRVEYKGQSLYCVTSYIEVTE